MIILIIGLGSIAQKHIMALRLINPEVIIFALRSVNNATHHAGIINIFSLDEMLSKPDFVIISNPTSLHDEAIKKAMIFECPLFIEKPVLGSLNNSEYLSNMLKEKKIVTYVACNMRFHPSILFIKKYLENNILRINEVNIYAGSYLPDWRPEKNFREIYSSMNKMGGGVHLDLIHELDYCYFLFGIPQDVKSVKRNVSSLGINSIDYANFNLIYPTFNTNIILNYYRRDACRMIEILTDTTTLTIDLLKNKILDHVNNKVLYHEEIIKDKIYVDQFTYFLEQLRNNAAPINSFDEGIKILKLALND
jgi:predicted dehydrogenase